MQNLDKYIKSKFQEKLQRTYQSKVLNNSSFSETLFSKIRDIGKLVDLRLPIS